MSENDYGVWLKARRSQVGMTLRALSDAANVGRSTLSDWESGKSLPRLTELDATLDVLGVSPAERQTVLQRMASPRALQRSQSDALIHCPEFVEKAGHLPHGGDLLRAMRTRKRWTMQQAVKHIGIQQSTLTRWERGEHFPDAAKLQTVCFVYGASEAEILALTCGRYSLTQESAANFSIDALEHHFRSELEPLELRAELNPGRELEFLSMEAALYPHALRNVNLHLLLAEVFAHHANYLRNWRLDSDEYAYRCLELMPRSYSLPDAAALAVVCVNDVLLGRAYQHRRQAAEWMHQWLKREFSPLALSWMLRKLSWVVRMDGNLEGAHAYLSEAERQSERASSNFDRTEIRRYRAMAWVNEGQAGKALELLPTTPDPYAHNRVRDALTRAEGLLNLDLLSEAHESLAAAYQDIEAYGLLHWQDDADGLARRF